MFLIDEHHSNQKLFTESKNIARSPRNWILNLENTYNYIARAIFSRDYLKMPFFELKNLSSPTFFDLKVYKVADMF